MKNITHDDEKRELENHLRRLEHMIDNLPAAERLTRAAELKRRLLSEGIQIDDVLEDAIKNFGNGTIGLGELSQALEGRI